MGILSATTSNQQSVCSSASYSKQARLGVPSNGSVSVRRSPTFHSTPFAASLTIRERSLIQSLPQQPKRSRTAAPSTNSMLAAKRPLAASGSSNAGGTIASKTASADKRRTKSQPPTLQVNSAQPNGSQKPQSSTATAAATANRTARKRQSPSPSPVRRNAPDSQPPPRMLKPLLPSRLVTNGEVRRKVQCILQWANVNFKSKDMKCSGCVQNEQQMSNGTSTKFTPGDLESLIPQQPQSREKWARGPLKVQIKAEVLKAYKPTFNCLLVLQS